MPDRVEPEDVCTTVEQAVDTAAALFDAQQFFQAHEFFEWAWKGPVTRDPDRPFFKGMAQLAVGYTHTQRGNAAGAMALLRRGIDHIAPFAPAHHGIDVQRAVEQARAFLQVLEHTEPGPQLEFPGFPAAR